MDSRYRAQDSQNGTGLEPSSSTPSHLVALCKKCLEYMDKCPDSMIMDSKSRFRIWLWDCKVAEGELDVLEGNTILSNHLRDILNSMEDCLRKILLSSRSVNTSSNAEHPVTSETFDSDSGDLARSSNTLLDYVYKLVELQSSVQLLQGSKGYGPYASTHSQVVDTQKSLSDDPPPPSREQCPEGQSSKESMASSARDLGAETGYNPVGPMAKFQYEPLDLSDFTRIRVLQLSPGRREDPIRCRLEPIILTDNPFDQHPSYEAISYAWLTPQKDKEGEEGTTAEEAEQTWYKIYWDVFWPALRTLAWPYSLLLAYGKTTGDPKANDVKKAKQESPAGITKRTIICNDAELSISFNLYSALIRFRDEKAIRTLWADAICINQEDEGEKTHQVRLMAKIYHNAQKVLIWLGEADESSDAAIAFIKDRIGRPDEEPFPSTFEAVLPFLTLLTRPWFKRVWIIQEVAMSRNHVLYCGSATVTWDEFFYVCYQFTQTTMAAVFTPFLIEYPININSARGPNASLLLGDRQISTSEVYRALPEDFLSVLLRHRRCQATDPRDKVFALCALVRDIRGNDDRIEPDYRLKKKDLYRNVAVGLLRQQRDLDILSVPRACDENGCLSLPSWIPDWSFQDFVMPIRASLGENNGLKATGNSTPKVTIEDKVKSYKGNSDKDDSDEDDSDEDDSDKDNILKHNILKLSGMEFDKITNVGRVLKRSTDDLQINLTAILRSLQLEKQTLLNWEALAKVHYKTYYVTGELMLEAYRLTLTSGHRNDENEIDERRQFELWFHNLSRFRWFHILLLDRTLYTFSFCELALQSMVNFLINRCGFVDCPWRQPLENFQNKLAAAASFRRMIKTNKGYIGLAPRFTKNGDCIALFKGGKMPLVIREVIGRDNSKRWKLVGECYVHGIMEGQAFKEEECEDMELV